MSLENVKSQNTALVFQGETLAGQITRDAEKTTFAYDKTYLSLDLPELALHLPKHSKNIVWPGNHLPPFFAGLLPEGLRLNALIRTVKTSADDMFSLLLATGQDCIGDISVIFANQTPAPASPTFNLNTTQPFLFSELLQKSLLYEDTPETSLPGIQNKISAGLVSLPVRNKQRSCILKLNSAEYENLVENEFFFMNLAKSCKISIPSVQIIEDSAHNKGLLVDRFDRQLDKQEKKIIKIHQEDACQFLNRYPADKYRMSYRDIAEGLTEYCTAPVLAVALLIRQMAFAYLIHNGDLHAKNISVLRNPKTAHVHLSPAYDLLTTLPYGDQSMALHMEGKTDNWKRRDFILFGKRFGVNEKVISRLLDEVGHAVESGINKMAQIGLSQKKTKHLQVSIRKRLGDLG